MFAPTYFPVTYFAPAYFPPGGEVVALRPIQVVSPPPERLRRRREERDLRDIRDILRLLGHILSE